MNVHHSGQTVFEAMSRCCACFAALLLLQIVSLVQSAPTVQGFGLPAGMRWDAAKLLEIQQQTEHTNMLYLRILRAQQQHRSLIEVGLIIDFITLAGVFLLCLCWQKKTVKENTIIDDKVAKVQL